MLRDVQFVGTLQSRRVEADWRWSAMGHKGLDMFHPARVIDVQRLYQFNSPGP